MNKILISISIVFCSLGAEAQVPNFDEWFRQKKTQKKYLAKQIALLQVYLGYLKKGYDIASKGPILLRILRTVTSTFTVIFSDHLRM